MSAVNHLDFQFSDFQFHFRFDAIRKFLALEC